MTTTMTSKQIERILESGTIVNLEQIHFIRNNDFVKDIELIKKTRFLKLLVYEVTTIDGIKYLLKTYK